jgi:DNA processing protein
MTMTGQGSLTDSQRYGAALAALGASPGTLRKFLDGYSPPEAWDAIVRGRHRADPERRYRARAVARTVADTDAACIRSGVSVTVRGQPGYPSALANDRQAPAVLFSQGDVTVLDGRPRVAVVGTRSATPYGLGVAAELGRDLARAGVVVVSGMALGVDAAAHAGVLGVDGAAPPVGILGTAHDAAGSRAHVALREAVGARGVVLSEIPPGAHSARWWFAVRNRVTAALAHVVVVVECHHGGGSLHTVSAALARGVTVSAVPGSVRSPASVGTNRLLVEGAVPVRDATDVLTAVELAIVADPDIAPPGRPPASSPPAPSARPAGPLGPVPTRVRQALDHDPATLETLVGRSGLPVGDVSLALEQLAEAGLAVSSRGWWSRPSR